MARIVEHLPVAELEARYRAARDATEARHYQAIRLLAQGRAGAARGGRGVERPRGGRLDRSPSRPGAGASAARLGSPEADRLVHPGAPTTACAGGGPRAAGRLQKGLEGAGAAAKAAHPDRPVEVWAADEHRLGLKPVRRRV